MKKTIFALFMTSLMLMGSSAISVSVKNCKNNSNIGASDNNYKPDFIINTLDLVKCRCPYGYIIRIRISNIGSEIEEISVKIKVKLDSDEKTFSMNYTKGVGSSPLHAAHLEIDFFKSTHIVTAKVDPPYEGHPKGDIIESNENNNVKSKSFKTNMKPQSSSLLNFLDIFQISFQILRHLLNCKVSFYPG